MKKSICVIILIQFFLLACAKKETSHLDGRMETQSTSIAKQFEIFSSRSYANEEEARLLLNNIMSSGGFEQQKASALLKCLSDEKTLESTRSRCWLSLGLIKRKEISISLWNEIQNRVFDALRSEQENKAALYLAIKFSAGYKPEMSAFVWEKLEKSKLQTEAKIFFISQVLNENNTLLINKNTKNSMQDFLIKNKSIDPIYMGVRASSLQKLSQEAFRGIVQNYCSSSENGSPFMCWRFYSSAIRAGIQIGLLLPSENNPAYTFSSSTNKENWDLFKQIEPQSAETIEQFLK